MPSFASAKKRRRLNVSPFIDAGVDLVSQPTKHHFGVVEHNVAVRFVDVAVGIVVGVGRAVVGVYLA